MSNAFDVIYECDDFLVVNKKSGVVVHKGVDHEDNTLADELVKIYPQLSGIGDGEDYERAGMVNRLDKDTSGVMLVAKTVESFLFYKRMFQDRKIKKEYYGVVRGVIKNDRGTVSRALKRSKGDFRKKTVVQAGEEGREAITEYVVRKRGDNITFVSMFPLTGRTHQLRVHMRSIGNPILGDKLYGNAISNVGVDRLALHSYRLCIPISNSSETKEFVAELPEDFQKLVDSI